MTRYYAAAQRYVIGFAILILFGLPTALHAECQATLQWDPNQSAVGGYRLYQRETGQAYNYSQYIDVGQSNTSPVTGLNDNTTYHFVVRAYLGADESGNSNEVTFDCNTGTPNNGGTPSGDANPPAQPHTITPSDNAQDVSMQPQLRTSAFYDPDAGDYHAQTRWQIFRMDTDACVYDTTSNSALTTMNVPSSVLDEFTAYYWTVRYYNQKGGISQSAPYSDFTTMQTAESNPSSTLSSGSSSGGSSGGGSGGGCFIGTLFRP